MTATEITTRGRNLVVDRPSRYDGPSAYRSIQVLIFVWLVANLLNSLTTTAGFAQGFVEISPVPKWALQNGGPIALWGIKVLGTLLFPALLWRGHLHRLFSLAGMRFGLTLGSLPVIAVALWEAAWLIGWLPF